MASLRTLEIGAKALIKATRVEGIFDRDPEKDNAAVKFDVFNFETEHFGEVGDNGRNRIYLV